MEMHGELRIPAPRQEVWEKLNDPETLKNCIPGCETVEKVSDTEFTAKLVARVGPVKASFSGKVTLTDLNPPAGYTITGEGTGGVAGFATASRPRSAASWRRSARASLTRPRARWPTSSSIASSAS
jgi:carbon monoxide dehydrogenase subunit G